MKISNCQNSAQNLWDALLVDKCQDIVHQF